MLNWFKYSPSFNWTLNFRNQVYEEMLAEGDNMTGYDRNNLMEIQYDNSELCHRADDKIRTFQADGSREADFPSLNYLTYVPYPALHMNDLTYFGRRNVGLC
jgi:isocitrate lyase